MVSKAIAYFLIFATASALLIPATDAFAVKPGKQDETIHNLSDKPAEALFEKALLLVDGPDSKAASLQLQEAMRLWVKMGQPDKAAKAALQLGERFQQARKYQDALREYDRAAKVPALSGAIQANVLNAIAGVYADLYLHDDAARDFNKSLNLARSFNDHAAQTRALVGLAELYQRQGDWQKALTYVTEALRLNKQGQDPDPTLLLLKGLLSQKQGAIGEAKTTFEEALTFYQKDRNAAGQVKVLCALSALSLVVSQKQNAIDFAEQAIKVAEGEKAGGVNQSDDVNSSILRWPAWLSLARAERALIRKESSLKAYSLAINHFKGMWWGTTLATEDSAIASREEVQAAYREYIALLMEQNDFKKAFKLADDAKGRTSLNFIGARQAKPTIRDNRQAATLTELSRSINRLQLQLLDTGLSRDQQAELQKQRDEALRRKQELEINEEMSRAGDRLVWTELANADTVAKQTAEQPVVLAEFSLGQERSFVWLFARGEMHYEILPSREEVETMVSAYLDKLAVRPNHLRLIRELVNLRAQSEALFTKLFGKLGQYLEPGQRLMVIPDGLLHYLPFETLVHRNRYLIEDHEISYNASASLFNLMERVKPRVENGDSLELLAVGDPNLDPKPASRTRNQANQGNQAALRTSLLIRKRLATRGLLLASLPGTRDEVQQIADLFPPAKRKLFLGGEGTEAVIKRETLSRYRRLHFATHSLIDEQAPARSAIVLSADHNLDEDGFLETGEIAKLKLDCDLVVVSACQSGRGKLLSGEGIIGFSRAFLYAGARRVVVSLWNVSDLSTGRLMKNFYQALTAGQSHTAALRQAKLQMLTSNQTMRHPHFWSSFVMIGKP